MMNPSAILSPCCRTIVVAFAGLLGQSVAALAQSDPTAALLAEVIRINTSNPPGNEGAIADLLAPRFRALGFEVDIVATPEPGKAHFIARSRATDPSVPSCSRPTPTWWASSARSGPWTRSPA